MDETLAGAYHEKETAWRIVEPSGVMACNRRSETCMLSR